MSSAPPRAITPRTAGAETDAWVGGFVAHALRRPWLPWQWAAADIIGEMLPDMSYKYPICVVLVPRQCGKTSMALDLALGRAIRYRGYRAAYAAQTGHVTSDKFGERFEEIAGSPLESALRLRRSQGTERIAVPAQRGYVKAFPPKAGALRSQALDLVVVDEAQEHDAELGHALDATIMPTFSTRPRRQLIVTGTAGTARSAYFRRYYDAARDGAPGYALIDYGFPESADPLDEAIWAAHHPGLMEGLTDLAALRQAIGPLGPAGFAREYGSIWSVGAEAGPIDRELWAAAAAPTFPLPAGRVALAFDVAPDRSETAIAAACRTDTGVHVRLVELRPGAAWAPARLRDLAAQLRAAVAYDEYGPAVDVAAETRRLGLAGLAGYGSSELALACMGLAGDLADARLSHAAQPPLDAAAAVAVRRRIGDRWVFDRRTPGLPITALMAAAIARHALLEQPAPAPKPAVYAA